MERIHWIYFNESRVGPLDNELEVKSLGSFVSLKKHRLETFQLEIFKLRSF